MATGPMKNPNPTEKTGTFTPSSGITISEGRVKQIGKVCEVHIVANKNGGFGSSQIVLGTISGVNAPPTIIRTVCGIGAQAYSANTVAYCFLNSMGEIGILPTNGSLPYAVIDFVYTVD